MTRIAVSLGFVCALALGGSSVQAQGQQANSGSGGIISGCEACENQYFGEYGTWAHRFQSDGGAGQDEDSDCTTGPNPDVNGCHDAWWDQACNYRHTMCYPLDLAVAALSAATSAGDSTGIELVLAKYKQISRRAGTAGFEMKSCDERYRVVVAHDGEIEVLLMPKQSSGE